jgi:hypothetical protein
MALPDYKNLGYKVTTRNVSYEQMVREAWGTEWGARDICYIFSNGATRLDTDTTKSGIYGIEIVEGLITEPLNPTYADMPIRIMTELGQMIGADNIGWVAMDENYITLNAYNSRDALGTETGAYLVYN